MFFIPRIVFARISQNTHGIVAEQYLEFIRFYMRIKKNYASLKKNVSLWDENSVEYLTINHESIVKKLFQIFSEEIFNCV